MKFLLAVFGIFSSVAFSFIPPMRFCKIVKQLLTDPTVLPRLEDKIYNFIVPAEKNISIVETDIVTEEPEDEEEPEEDQQDEDYHGITE